MQMKKNQPITSTQKYLAIINIILFVLTLIINTLANALPINGLKTGEISDRYPNLFVPAGFTFSIWGVIYLLLLASVIQQSICTFNTKKSKNLSSSFQLLFGASLVLNMAWILAWHYLYIALSVMVMITLLRVLISLYKRSKKVAKNSKTRYFTIQAPIELYYGWIVIATIANVTALLVETQWTGCPLSEMSWTIIMILGALALTITKLTINRAFVFAAVVIWALIGIIAKRDINSIDESTIIYVSTASILIIGSFGGYLWATRHRNLA